MNGVAMGPWYGAMAMGPWLEAVAMKPWLWGRGYVLNGTNRKRTKRVFPKCRGKRWKNWIKMKINMQEKHTNPNNMKWWGVSSVEYLAPSHRKFLNSFNIDVADMGQRRRDIESKWYQGEMVTQGEVNHVNRFYSYCIDHRSQCYIWDKCDHTNQINC